MATAFAAVAAVCAVASLVFVTVSVKQAGRSGCSLCCRRPACVASHTPHPLPVSPPRCPSHSHFPRVSSLRRTELWGWTKDSMESGDGKISAEEVEQLNSILDAQDNLKKNLKTMAEKLDKGRGTEIAVEQGNNSPAGPDGERGAQGPKGPPGPTGVVGPQGALGKEGAMGLKGAQGGVGSPGKRGPGGEQGGIGSFGLEGPKGNMGAVGYAGAPGAPGPQVCKSFKREPTRSKKDVSTYNRATQVREYVEREPEQTEASPRSMIPMKKRAFRKHRPAA